MQAAVQKIRRFTLGRNQGDFFTTPRERNHHRTSIVGDSLYVWGGAQPPRPRGRIGGSDIQEFPLSFGAWLDKPTTGNPPQGDIGYCCAAIDSDLFFFGGYCGATQQYHNSITKLATSGDDPLQWKELPQQTNPARPVMQRAYGGMIPFEHNGEQLLLMVGGVGSEPTKRVHGAEYVERPDNKWCTNEQSIYNLSLGKTGNKSNKVNF